MESGSLELTSSLQLMVAHIFELFVVEMRHYAKCWISSNMSMGIKPEAFLGFFLDEYGISDAVGMLLY